MVENEIPFPFLNNMTVEKRDSSGNPAFYKVIGQGTTSTLTVDYTITPGGKLTDQTITAGGSDAFKTTSTSLKEWVSWIDNENLQVSWTLGNTKINQLNGVSYPLTFDTSPIGSFTMPLATVNDPTPNVSFDLINGSSSGVCRGTFKVILVSYRVERLQNPVDTYTSLDYSGGTS